MDEQSRLIFSYDCLAIAGRRKRRVPFSSLDYEECMGAKKISSQVCHPILFHPSGQLRKQIDIRTFAYHVPVMRSH